MENTAVLSKDKSQYKVNLQPDVHKAIRLISAETRVSIQDIVDTGLRQYLKMEPNNAG